MLTYLSINLLKVREVWLRTKLKRLTIWNTESICFSFICLKCWCCFLISSFSKKNPAVCGKVSFYCLFVWTIVCLAIHFVWATCITFLSCISLFLHTFPQNLLASHFCKMHVWFGLLLEFLISLLQLFLCCSILTPYYKEDVLFSLQNLEEPNEDGVSILFYLQKIYPGYFLTCLPFTWTDIHAIFLVCPLPSVHWNWLFVY